MRQKSTTWQPYGRTFSFLFRELRKNPGLALTAILSITLGIGATTAVFSVIYGLLVNPFPYSGADRMIYLDVIDQSGNNREVEFTGPQLNVLRQAKCIESLAAGWGTWNLTTTDEDLPEDVPAVYVPIDFSPPIARTGMVSFVC